MLFVGVGVLVIVGVGVIVLVGVGVGDEHIVDPVIAPTKLVE
jgi:hypothetical protein